jgi:5'(3')-deoxyribonucleotidase
MRDYVITPEDFLNFKPIKGSIKFINNLYEKGYTISFCSRVISYKDYPEVKYQWLNKYFSDINFDLMIVSNSITKRLLKCKYIIDDSIDVAREVDNALVPIKPWNKKFLKNNKTVISFNDFKELEALL